MRALGKVYGPMRMAGDRMAAGDHNPKDKRVVILLPNF